MEFVQQSLEDILDSLSPLPVEWQDDTSRKVIDLIGTIPIKHEYTTDDIVNLLSEGFAEGLIVCQLFLGLSKDAFTTELDLALGAGGRGVKRFNSDREAYLQALVVLGLPEAMAAEVNRELAWSDVLIERLRSGRGRAISGQRRGRGLEDFAESIIQTVFGEQYDTRCQFIGSRGAVAKCDFAIPSKICHVFLSRRKGTGPPVPR